MPSIPHQLAEALQQRRMVRIVRRFETTKVRGYVQGIGAELFLIALVSDRLWLDGFECFRLDDASEIEEDPYAEFAEAALRERGERLQAVPKIKLDSIAELLLSAQQAFPLVAILREEADPKIAQIGRVQRVEHGHAILHEISPGARWLREHSELRLSEITRVAFGGDYEEALHMIGGDPS